MDDLFEQILSVPPWLDRSGMSRTAWEASAMSASSNIFGSLGIQRMPPGHSAGDVDNQAPLQDCHGGVVMGEGAQMTSNKIAVLPQHSCAHKIPLLPTNNKSILQTGPSATASPTESAAFTTSKGFEGQQLPYSRQSPPEMLPTWRQPFASNGTLTSPALVQGKPDPFSSVGGMPNDLHPGKRQREDEDMMHDIQVCGINNGEQPISLVQNPLGSARPRIRARRGQATDPHSIAERNRRERIAERMKALQELVPDSNKTDKASMLDEIIGYVKFLQMQVKCLSMCRLGGAGAGAPLLADLPAEGAASFIAANLVQATGASNDGIALAEQQVARLMDEDMSAAMQYLQSKGLCLMPISLATAISSSGGASKHHSSPLKCPGTGGTERQPTDVVPGVAKSTSSTSLSGNGDLDRTNEVGPGPSVTGDFAMSGLVKSEDPYR